MKETLSKKETPVIIGVGLIIGILAVALVYFGNPANLPPHQRHLSAKG